MRILCFGDSNTWGFNPITKMRYARDQRWTGVLHNALGEQYEIIEEGLNGRTTLLDDPLEPGRDGLSYLYPCLLSHAPLNLVILMLGTNDLKLRFSMSAADIARGVSQLVLCIQRSAAGYDDHPPETLLICPPPVGNLTEFAESFEGAEPKSQRLSRHYEAVSKEFGCHFLDAGRWIVSSGVDGIHLDASEHKKLGLKVAEVIQCIF